MKEDADFVEALKREYADDPVTLAEVLAINSGGSEGDEALLDADEPRDADADEPRDAD